ncbi:MAG: hypothetical protein HY924_14450 [Elusimicrobia bacterium]|nr:hypothetical protein [Elusimicrobiota bacterium]
MKLSTLIVALMLAVPAFAGDGEQAKSRCDTAGLKAPVAAIPTGIGREQNKVCQAAVWEYLDVQGKTVLFKNTQYGLRQAFLDAGTDTDQAAAVKAQQEILKSVADQFDAVDKKAAEIEAVVKDLQVDLKTVTGDAATLSGVELGKRSLSKLIAKEGDDLAVEYKAGQTVAASKNPVVGGKTYADLVGRMFELAKLDLVQRHLKDFNEADQLDYVSAADPKPKSFNLGHMGKLYGDDAACKAQGDVPAFCSVDKALGKKVRELYLEARKTLNAANQHVKAKKSTVAQIAEGYDRLLAQEGEQKKEFTAAVAAKFKEKAAGLSGSELFDGNLTKEQLAAVEPKLRDPAVSAEVITEKGVIMDGKGNKYGVKLPEKLAAPGAQRDQQIQAEADRILAEYKKGNTVKAVAGELGFALKPDLAPKAATEAGQKTDTGTAPAGAVNELDAMAGCDSPADAFRTDAERIEAEKLDKAMKKQRGYQEAREGAQTKIEECVEKAEDKRDDAVSAAKSKEYKPWETKTSVESQRKAELQAANDAFAADRKACLSNPEFTKGLKDIASSEEELKTDKGQATEVAGGYEKKQFANSVAALWKDYKKPGSTRIKTTAFQLSSWSAEDLQAALPDGRGSVIDGFFGAVARGNAPLWNAEACQKTLKGMGLNPTEGNIDRECVGDKIMRYAKAVEGTFAVQAGEVKPTVPPVGGTSKEREEELKRKYGIKLD